MLLVPFWLQNIIEHIKTKVKYSFNGRCQVAYKRTPFKGLDEPLNIPTNIYLL